MARKNGAAIIADPAVGLEALTHTQATFTHRDLAMFAHRHSDGKEQFDRALAAMRHHESVLALGRDGRGAERFTTRSMMRSEEHTSELQSLMRTSYAVFCLKKKTNTRKHNTSKHH